MSTPFHDISITTYVINLKERIDRLEHIKKQFYDKPEFDLHIIEACRNEIGAVGLWESIVTIIKKVISGEDDVVIICEDDHIFTEDYNKEYLFQNIINAAQQGVELLSGGIGGFSNAIPITENLYWIDSFWSTQFIILHRPIFHKILEERFKSTDTADGMFSELTSHKMVLYPFISVQYDSGYSDVTLSNDNLRGLVTKLFEDADKKMNVYYKAYQRYLKKID